MNCEQIGKILKDYIEVNLDKEHLYIVASHIKKCPRCRMKLTFVSFLRILPRLILVLIITGISIFIVGKAINHGKPHVKIGREKLDSNIIIEVYSKDPEGDGKILKGLSDSFDGKVISDKPFSIKLAKKKVMSLIGTLDNVLVFPEGTHNRIEEFIAPLKENEEIVVNINIIKKD